MKKILLLFIICCFNSLSYTQIDTGENNIDTAEAGVADSADHEAIIKFDQPILRHISTDSMQALKQQDAFAYMQYIDSVFRNHKYPQERITRQEEKIEKPGLFDNPGLRMFYWSLAFGAVLWVVWSMFIGKGSVFTRNKKMHVPAFDDDIAIITDLSTEELIEKAISESNYRMATRFMYLQTLDLLGEKELIAMAPQKTNYHYLQELTGKSQQPGFSKLTLHYEYVWYGGFKLSFSQFETIYKEFQNFRNELN